MKDSGHKDTPVSGVIRVVSHYESLLAESIKASINSEKEKHRVSDAICVAMTELKGQMEALGERLTETETEIFLTQVFLLEDGELEEAIFEAIDTQCLRAEDAVLAARDSLAALFQNISDEALQSRFNDIDGVCSYILDILRNERQWTDDKIILAGETLAPHLFLQNHSRIVGCVSTVGSVQSHVSLLCKSNGIPYLTDIPIAPHWNQQWGSLDSQKGIFSVNQTVYTGRVLVRARQSRLEQHSYIPTKVKVKANVHSLHDIDEFDLHSIDGIGLVRSEFLFMELGHLPTTDEQTLIYASLSKLWPEIQINIRLLDIGDEKQLPFFRSERMVSDRDHRAIRVLLSETSLLQSQLEAILLANKVGNLRILVPFITSMAEIRAIKASIDAIHFDLFGPDAYPPQIQIGAMIETPAAVMVIEEILKEVDFISIGTNDLLYTLYAVDRMNPHAMEYIDKGYTALINAISQIITAAHARRKSVCVCGELAGQKEMVDTLIKMGIDELSVPVEMIAEIRKWVYQAEHTTE